MDRYTETSYTSYGQNIGNSFKGILVGLLFLVGSMVLLWWNEGRSVAQADALEENPGHAGQGHVGPAESHDGGELEDPFTRP